nr:hypothetical protein [Tanacetum cinerariifolium]
MEHVLQENDRLLTQALSVEIVNVVVHDNVMSDCLNVDVCAHCVTIKSKLKKDFIKKECYETEFFEINELKAQAQAKDIVILQLKEKLRSLKGDVTERNVKREVEEIETLNIELDHKVTKLVAKNEHLKQTYKQLLQEKVLVVTALKEQLSKLKGKAVLTEAEALVSKEAWAKSVGLSSTFHQELQALTTTFVAQVSFLQGQLSAALG